MGDRLAEAWRYARAHHVVGLVGGICLLASVNLFFGSLNLVLPSSTGSVNVPFRRELPIGFAVIAVGSLHSAMASMELAATARLRRAECVHLAVVAGLAAGTLAVSETLATSPAQAVMYVRAMSVWFGLALVSARIFGRQLSWVLPIMTIFPLVYYGRDEFGRARWWEWTSQPADNVGAWAICASSLFAGVVAYFATTWRLRTAIRVRHGHRGNP